MGQYGSLCLSPSVRLSLTPQKLWPLSRIKCEDYIFISKCGGFFLHACISIPHGYTIFANGNLLLNLICLNQSGSHRWIHNKNDEIILHWTCGDIMQVQLVDVLENFEGCPRGVMVKAMDCGIVVREFILQSWYYVHFRANTLGKGKNPLILPAMG